MQDRKLKITSAQESYSFFDLDITPDEQRSIDAFNIENCSSYKCEPENLNNLLNEIEDYLKQAGSNDVQARIAIAELILKQITRILRHFDKETGQIIIRTFTKSPEFDIPRWHIDGEYFSLSYLRKHNRIILLPEESPAIFDSSALIITKVNGKVSTHETHVNNKLSRTLSLSNTEIDELDKLFPAKGENPREISRHDDEVLFKHIYFLCGCLPPGSETGGYFKTAFALKGAPTLFCTVNPQIRKSVNALPQTMDTIDRKNIQRVIDESGATIETPPSGNGAIFRVSSNDVGAFHSEPKIDSPRLFVSVLPVTKNQVKENEFFNSKLWPLCISK